MTYKVLKKFKDRYNEFKKYKSNDVYEPKNEAHTKLLLDKGFIYELPKKPDATKKTAEKKAETKKVDKK